MASMPVGNVAEELWDFASNHVELMGRSFGDGAAEDLRRKIETGGRKLEAIEDDYERSGEVAKAKAALIELLDKAAEIAGTLDDYPDDLLGERSYYPALDWFCPRWPFC